MKEVMTPNEVARLLRCRPDYIYRLLERGDLVGFKIGNGWRVTSDSLKEWITKRERRHER